MARSASVRRTKKLTLDRLDAELPRLRRSVEDLEDLRDLNAAIRRNNGKPGILWSEVKEELGL